MSRALPLWLALTFIASASVGSSQQRPRLLAGIDHVPVAVRDLERAGETYRRLGFVLKPGTPHANGIRNLHAKFRDGTEIELITAPKAVDALTRTYLEHLKQGDGPAFLALHAPYGRAMAETIPDDHPARRYIFFGSLNHSPTDRPEHFEHPNGAESLVRVWLAADDFAAEIDLLSRAGFSTQPEAVLTPQAARVPVARLGASALVFLPGPRQIIPGRRIVGATVAVRNLDAAASHMRAHGIEVPAAIPTAGGRSLFLAPELTCGWWIELTQRVK